MSAQPALFFFCPQGVNENYCEQDDDNKERSKLTYHDPGTVVEIEMNYSEVVGHGGVCCAAVQDASQLRPPQTCPQLLRACA